VTLAIGLHNIPEGLAVSTVLVARGISPRSALLWTLFTAMPQPLVAVPSFLFVDTFKALLPMALGFAAGCMVWMVFAELLPDALEDAPHGTVTPPPPPPVHTFSFPGDAYFPWRCCGGLQFLPVASKVVAFLVQIDLTFGLATRGMGSILL
jgi:hypothetical protein